ncbi:MAG: DUF1320 domain-containing protein [Proteobacteria bacterium]|nr:DUF1320 domain-containing protein [Pseudomonadota bacterium]MCL2306738.1 DUF1320 domain-containing protein [Pseudomonadota bacterium]
MPFYATREQMIKAFGEREIILITSETGDLINDEVLNLALDDATSEIDSYISKRYGHTLLNNPPLRLIGVCCDIARYRLYDDAAIESVRIRYTDAIKFLEAVRDGKNNLGDEIADAGSTGRVLMTAAPRRFDRASLRDY